MIILKLFAITALCSQMLNLFISTLAGSTTSSKVDTITYGILSPGVGNY